MECDCTMSNKQNETPDTLLPKRAVIVIYTAEQIHTLASPRSVGVVGRVALHIVARHLCGSEGVHRYLRLDSVAGCLVVHHAVHRLSLSLRLRMGRGSCGFLLLLLLLLLGQLLLVREDEWRGARGRERIAESGRNGREVWMAECVGSREAFTGVKLKQAFEQINSSRVGILDYILERDFGITREWFIVLNLGRLSSNVSQGPVVGRTHDAHDVRELILVVSPTEKRHASYHFRKNAPA